MYGNASEKSKVAVFVSDGGGGGAAAGGDRSTFHSPPSTRKPPTAPSSHHGSPVAVVAPAPVYATQQQPAPVYATPARGGAAGDVSPHRRHSPIPPPPPPPPHGPSTRPIPPLPEFEDTPSFPARNGLPSYEAVVYQQLCGSPVPPGEKKSSQHLQVQQQQVQHLPLMQRSLHEGSATQTPVFERAGMKAAHSTSSISRGRVARTPNQASKESAL